MHYKNQFHNWFSLVCSRPKMKVSSNVNCRKWMQDQFLWRDSKRRARATELRCSGVLVGRPLRSVPLALGAQSRADNFQSSGNYGKQAFPILASSYLFPLEKSPWNQKYVLPQTSSSCVAHLNILRSSLTRISNEDLQSLLSHLELAEKDKIQMSHSSKERRE